KIMSGSPVHIGPRIRKDKSWDFTHNFPQTFEVGEIKPLFPTEFTVSMAYHGTAPLQVDHYLRGYEEFIKQVRKDIGPPVPTDPKGSPINIPEDKIPDSINYKKFVEQREKRDEHTILKNRNITGEQTTPRLWIFQTSPGLFVYFLITHPYTKK